MMILRSFHHQMIIIIILKLLAEIELRGQCDEICVLHGGRERGGGEEGQHRTEGHK